MPTNEHKVAMRAVENSKRGMRRHRGDFLAPEVRSAVMARIKGKDTGPELLVGSALSAAGLRFEKHAKDLPGRPDLVFRPVRVAVFIDGDFWHGWRFSVWRDKLSEKWEAKIESNRRRDVRNHRQLRRNGWTVIRLWEHQVEQDLKRCVARVVSTVTNGKRG
jgi:DNA mismatch endonuclease (patch repair protein)